MASQMLASTIVSPPIQQVAITNQQSLALSKIFINATIASVFWFRNISKHSSDAFSDRYVGDLLDAAGSIDYDTVMAAEIAPLDSKYETFKVLVKGSDEKINQVLQLLEVGVFSVLDSSVLDALQLNIYPEANNTDQVLESHTLRFTYASPSGPGSSISGVSVSPASQFIVGDAERGFNAAINTLFRSLPWLPRLPHNKRIGFTLFFRNDNPNLQITDPPGFQNCDDGDFMVPKQRNLVWECSKPITLTTGARRVEVFHNYVEYRRAKGLNFDLPSTMRYHVQGSLQGQYEALDDDSRTASLTELSSIRPRVTASQDRQKKDQTIKRALKKMLMSSPTPPGLTPTQTHPSANNALDIHHGKTPMEIYEEERRLLPGCLIGRNRDVQRRRVVTPAKWAELLLHAHTVDQSHNKTRPKDQGKMYDYASLLDCRIERHFPNELRCECKETYDDEKEAMMMCVMCGYFQHTACYGFDEVDERRHVRDHVCYSCLLLPQEAELNSYMPLLVTARLALRYLWKNGFPRRGEERDMAKAMRYAGQIEDLMESDAIRELQKEHCITINGRRRRIVRDVISDHFALTLFLDPMARIFHHYEIAPVGQFRHDIHYSQAYADLWQKWDNFAIDTIMITNVFGQEIVRYGFYPHMAQMKSLAATSPLEVARASQSGTGPGVTGTRARKMSRSALIDFNCSDTEQDESKDNADGDATEDAAGDAAGDTTEDAAEDSAEDSTEDEAVVDKDRVQARVEAARAVSETSSDDVSMED